MAQPLTRPFRPWDAISLRDGSVAATPLEIESVVLEGSQPVRRALQACVWPGHSHPVTVVLAAPAKGEPPGFCQARRRCGLVEGDLIWLAPSLSTGNGAARHWSRLVWGTTQALGARGIQRVFVALPRDDTLALGVFHQAGFVAYAEDTVYCRPWGAPDGDPPAMSIAQEAPEHLAPILRLLAPSQPTAAATAPNTPDWETYPLGGWLPAGARRRVWLGRRGEVLGAWRWLPGQSGHWLRPVVAAEADPADLLRRALAEASAAGDRSGPVYVAARRGEARLQRALVGEGFEPLLDRRRLVKHTTARLMTPAWRRQRLPEPASEVTAARGAPLGRTVHRSTPAEPPSRSTP